MTSGTKNTAFAIAAATLAVFGLVTALFLTSGDSLSHRSAAEEATGAPETPMDADAEAHPFPAREKLMYIKIIDSCGPAFDGACVNVRAKPSTTSPSLAKLRTGIVLQAAGTVESEGRTWYKIVFNEWLRYPERHDGTWYVAGDSVVPVMEDAPENYLWPNKYAAAMVETVSRKHITVDLSEQKLYAYDGDTLFMEVAISSGIPATPSPLGTFIIYRKTPSRYMQGPIPGISTHEYDLPGVPWNMYFTQEGAVIHGAYWHNEFGHVHSNGCINLPPEKAEELYHWGELGMRVTIQQ